MHSIVDAMHWPFKRLFHQISIPTLQEREACVPCTTDRCHITGAIDIIPAPLSHCNKRHDGIDSTPENQSSIMGAARCLIQNCAPEDPK
ncbi:hypothetical protein [Ensifer adhaerens]|uniref:hypothetical protein n=1 Tax=Ensifer adhaerens TaxID=106592 RepID=UPI00128F9BE0|nr:hypothetical protein [Ensifer adhaerens]